MSYKWKFTYISATVAVVVSLLLWRILKIFPDYSLAISQNKFVFAMWPPNWVHFAVVASSNHTAYDKGLFFSVNSTTSIVWLIWAVSNAFSTMFSRDFVFLKTFIPPIVLVLCLFVIASLLTLDRNQAVWVVSIRNSMNFINLHMILYISIVYFFGAIIVDYLILNKSVHARDIHGGHSGK